MDVGVRELKAHLSAYLERAAAGEVITITDRGRPTALLTPIPGIDRVEQGLAEGWIHAPTSGTLQPRVARPSRRTVREVLNEDRSG